MKNYIVSKKQDTFFIEQFILNLYTDYFNKNNLSQGFSFMNCGKTDNESNNLR